MTAEHWIAVAFAFAFGWSASNRMTAAYLVRKLRRDRPRRTARTRILNAVQRESNAALAEYIVTGRMKYYKLTFREAISGVETISRDNAAVTVRTYNLSERGKASLSGQGCSIREMEMVALPDDFIGPAVPFVATDGDGQ